MRHFASPSFWAAYGRLPDHIRQLADKNFALLKQDSAHPGLRHRALAVESDGELVWFWIGTHADYDKLLS